MTVTVTPERFVLVDFDAELTHRIATELAEHLDLADDTIAITVDERTLLGRIRVQVDGEAGGAGGITVVAESGALEDTRRPRHQSERATRFALGWALLRARDRLRGGFADAPPDDALTHAQRSAWNAYLGGRLHRLGVDVGPQRLRYDFRNRLGFTDATDRAFDQLWWAEALHWSRVVELSAPASS